MKKVKIRQVKQLFDKYFLRKNVNYNHPNIASSSKSLFYINISGNYVVNRLFKAYKAYKLISN